MSELDKIMAFTAGLIPAFAYIIRSQDEFWWGVPASTLTFTLLLWLTDLRLVPILLISVLVGYGLVACVGEGYALTARPRRRHQR